MQNVNKYFSIAIVVALLCVAIISIPINNSIFNDISKATAIPLLLFTLINSVKFGLDGVVQISEHEINASISNKKVYIENRDFAERICFNKDNIAADETVKRWQSKINDNEYKCEIHWSIINRIKSWKPWGILYTSFLTLLFLSMLLSPLISAVFPKLLKFAEHPVFPLIAITITISQALFGNCLIEKVSDKMINDEHKKNVVTSNIGTDM